MHRWIARNAAWQPDRPALIADGVTITYRELAARIDALAAGLAHDLKLARGDRIAVLAYNRSETIALIFAAARIGAIVVPMNWRLAPPEHAFVLSHSGAVALFVDHELAAQGATIASTVPRLVLGGPDCAIRRWSVGGRESPERGQPDDPLLLVYTSGTTGRPKGAVLTQDMVAWNAVNAIHAHDLTAADRVLTALPLFHVGGLNIQTLPALMIGAEVILQPRFAPDAMLAAIARARPSVTLVVPAVMKALIEHPAWGATDLSSLRLIMAGSSVVPVDLIRAIHARGIPCGQIYGSTETGPVAVVLKAADARAKEGAAGTPAIACDIKLVEREVWVRGPNVARGYWRDEDAAAFADGWFRTGDIGHLDDDGYLWIDDRKKDMIISGGENIYPAEVEAVLSGHPAIADAAVVARPDAKWGEVPVAVVVLRPGATLDAEAVKAWFAGKLARFKHPHDVIVVDALPRNAMGKVLRYELRARLGRQPA